MARRVRRRKEHITKHDRAQDRKNPEPYDRKGHRRRK